MVLSNKSSSIYHPTFLYMIYCFSCLSLQVQVGTIGERRDMIVIGGPPPRIRFDLWLKS